MTALPRWILADPPWRIDAVGGGYVINALQRSKGVPVCEFKGSVVTQSALRLLATVANLLRIIGVDLVCAAQGVSFRAPLATSAPLAAAMAWLRADVPPPVEDRALDRDPEAAAFPVRDEDLVRAAGLELRDLGPDNPKNESAA